MTFSKHFHIFIAAFILCSFSAKAQDKPIGYWESHLPYNSALGVATDGNTVYAICNQGFFTYKPATSDIAPYSKVEGMSDMGMQCVGYDFSTSSAILVYADGNIDLFKDNTFYNIPDLKIKTVAGIKAVNAVYAENGIAYLSTSLGIILVNLSTRNIDETYQFIKNNQVIPVSSLTGIGDSFYAVTPGGLYKASKNSPDLQNFQVWTNTDSTDTFTTCANLNNVLYLANSRKVYTYTNGTVTPVYTTSTTITHISPALNSLFIGEIRNLYQGRETILSAANQVIDSFFTYTPPIQAVQLLDSSMWAAAPFTGLQRRTDSTNVTGCYPFGPYDANAYDIYASNKNVWIAHGAYTQSFIGKGSGSDLSNLSNGNWKSYHQFGGPPQFDTIQDVVSVVRDEIDGTVYAGSFQDGLIILKKDGTSSTIKQNLFDTSTSAYDRGQRQVIGTALDQNENLWVSLYSSQHQLYAKTKDSTWYKFQMPGFGSGGPLAIDNNGQVWYVCLGTGGVGVFNYNGTLSDPTDDASYHLQKGTGYGNLPSNGVLCIAVDKSNNVWIGTDNGIGISSGCSGPFTQQNPPCDAEIPIVQYDQFAGYLFAGSNVRTIAVDGANRKWVGTDNGVWLLSPDASQIIYRFTAENSPLPSDNIQKISIDKITGDVYIGTYAGVICYHSTAVEGGTTNQSVVTYPNPVPSGYTGTIAIKGLAADADVRITDISGQLVYRTMALGGQAVWNGTDYKGHRPQSGVYLIFVSSSDGSQTYTGKMVFMQ